MCATTYNKNKVTMKGSPGSHDPNEFPVDPTHGK
ncbi:uncharacterized protein CTRU02_213755 [Colletotrichum truncatum]|uniref:Uncharacterized protein n=1 Tax=Colletotrichum truncatum TaxID=5467 RepID=A0ACC3YGL6_COLTU|nr:uncharacterized protein CTRU02_14679 [Colletotrichum truncatum]KAF6781895.1 hypothetical protein CTRU02_14679 [Colletotrichum truncatum]